MTFQFAKLSFPFLPRLSDNGASSHGIVPRRLFLGQIKLSDIALLVVARGKLFAFGYIREPRIGRHPLVATRAILKRCQCVALQNPAV
jgi:hypothetical protein